MRKIIWNIYIAYLKIRGHRTASQAVFQCHKKLRLLILKAFGAKIAAHSGVNSPLILFGRYKDFSALEIGEQTHIGADTIFDLCEKINIGSRVAISPRCSFITHFNAGAGHLQNQYPPVTGGVSIGDDVYIGTGVTVLHGVKIGNGALIAAHSLVNEDVAENTMVAGVPARFVKNITKKNDG